MPISIGMKHGEDKKAKVTRVEYWEETHTSHPFLDNFILLFRQSMFSVFLQSSPPSSRRPWLWYVCCDGGVASKHVPVKRGDNRA